MGWLERLGWPSGPPPFAETRSAPVSPTIVPSASYEEWLAFLGISSGPVQLPPVTIESALRVPAVAQAVNFLSATLASLPLHAYGANGKIDGELAMLLNEAPNPEWSSFEWRRYTWHQVFTGGRGTSWIERDGVRPVAIWPMEPAKTKVLRKNGRKFYQFEQREPYPASDVIDLTFMLRPDGLGAYGPIALGRETIGLAIAMNSFAAQFFAGGGVPPLALEGPMPSGPDAFRRATADIQRAIDLARASGSPFFGMPPGHALKPVGTDPDKGQMTEARLFQIQEIARLYGLPPVFLQDLSRGTFSNTEQQDLQLVKHNVAQRARQFEDELNLKLFGQRRRARKVKHNLDGLQRGAFKDRIEALARGVQTAQITPNEARALEEREPLEHGDELYIQGATVPLGSPPPANPAPAPLNDEGTDADAGTSNA